LSKVKSAKIGKCEGQGKLEQRGMVTKSLRENQKKRERGREKSAALLEKFLAA